MFTNNLALNDRMPPEFFKIESNRAEDIGKYYFRFHDGTNLEIYQLMAEYRGKCNSKTDNLTNEELVKILKEYDKTDLKGNVADFICNFSRIPQSATEPVSRIPQSATEQVLRPSQAGSNFPVWGWGLIAVGAGLAIYMISKK